MNPVVLLLLTLVGAYLAGGIPFGYLVARWRGVNIFEQGSGNIGATNVGRVLGRKFGILVFVLDFAKGALTTAVALAISEADELGDLPREAFGVGAGLAAFLGHLFPLYLGFRGGKGVATATGVVVVLFPWPAAVAVLAWLVVVLASRTVSLASLVATLTVCVLHLITTAQPFTEGRLLTSGFCLLAASLIIVRHRANIQRLLQGTENRLAESSAMNQFSKTVHVLSLGLWFGSAVFFLLIVTLSIFHTFETIGTSPDRPNWFPAQGTIFNPANNPDGLKEQGSRAAGVVVGPLFTLFFILQVTCGLLTVVTCLSWPRTHPQERVHKIRTGVVLAALMTVLVGWPIEQKVVDLRGPRNQKTDEVLTAGAHATDSQREAMNEARRDFAIWHLISLGLSFVTLALVGVAMALAARLPVDTSKPVAENPAVPVENDDTIIQPSPQETGKAHLNP